MRRTMWVARLSVLWLVFGAGCTQVEEVLFNPTTETGTGGSTSASTSTSTATGGAGGGETNGCKEGGDCDGEERCCDGDELLACSEGHWALSATCGELEACVASVGACVCPLAARRCTPGDGSSLQVCHLGEGGVSFWVTVPCGPGGACSAGVCQQECEPCDPADPAFTCADDGTSVLGCAHVPGSACSAERVAVLDCKAAGMKNGCSIPQGPPPSSPEDLCVNECNVRGAPLSGDLCGASPAVLCGVLLCDAAGTELVSDHTGCASGGTQCAQDSDCASCNCDGGLCFGSFIKACPITGEQCP